MLLHEHVPRVFIAAGRPVHLKFSAGTAALGRCPLGNHSLFEGVRLELEI